MDRGKLANRKNHIFVSGFDRKSKCSLYETISEGGWEFTPRTGWTRLARLVVTRFEESSP
jgi:hypothetical protein